MSTNSFETHTDTLQRSGVQLIYNDIVLPACYSFQCLLCCNKNALSEAPNIVNQKLNLSVTGKHFKPWVFDKLKSCLKSF